MSARVSRSVTADDWRFHRCPLTHNARIADDCATSHGDLGIDTKVGPRSENLIVLTSTKPGTYEFYCRITGHWETMHGVLTIR